MSFEQSKFDQLKAEEEPQDEKIEENLKIPESKEEKFERVEKDVENKDLKLKEIRQEVESIGDRLGRPIDEGIKETVIMFKVNELPTSDSCEGHIERGLPVPYIEISAHNEPERWEGVNDALEKIKLLKESDNKKYHEEYWKILKEFSQKPETLEYQDWEKEKEKLKKKAEKLLDEFYKNRKVDSDVKLQIEEGIGDFRIHNGGKNYKSVIEEERKFSEEEKKIRAEKVEKYRAEMKEFTGFLKDKYFGK